MTYKVNACGRKGWAWSVWYMWVWLSRRSLHRASKLFLFLANIPMLFLSGQKKDSPSSLTWTLKVVKHVAQHCSLMCFCFENQISFLNFDRPVRKVATTTYETGCCSANATFQNTNPHRCQRRTSIARISQYRQRILSTIQNNSEFNLACIDDAYICRRQVNFRSIIEGQR